MEKNTGAIDPRSFFRLAIQFEGALILVALILGWFVEVNPMEDLHADLYAIFWGLLGTVPLFLLLLLFYRYPIGPLYSIKRLLIEVLGPCLSVCSVQQMALIAAVAGFSEELLFRGALQPWFENLWGVSVALLLSNVLFGLAHAVTWAYLLLAGFIGVYLALFMDIGEQRNVLIPIIIHAVYDFLAFLVVAQSYRTESRDKDPDSTPNTTRTF